MRSPFFQSLRHLSIQAKERSTIQRFGSPKTSTPICNFAPDTFSPRHSLFLICLRPFPLHYYSTFQDSLLDTKQVLRLESGVERWAHFGEKIDFVCIVLLQLTESAEADILISFQRKRGRTMPFDCDLFLPVSWEDMTRRRRCWRFSK